MLSVISPGWKDRQEDWDQISRLVSWDIFQMLLGARLGQVIIGIDLLILSAELNMREKL